VIPESSIRYVGPPELHCGHVIGVERAGDRATVRVRDADGRHVVLEFGGVADFAAMRPEGMLLHGLAELRPADVGEHDTLRHFVFANEEEWDDAFLEIAAREFRVQATDHPEAID
jgi:hypothetical protein